jgi:hypothetical protein
MSRLRGMRFRRKTRVGASGGGGGGARSLLTPADFSYVGDLYVPYITQTYPSSRGSLTSRTVGESRRLLMLGTNGNPDLNPNATHVMEMEVPQTAGGAPQVTFLPDGTNVSGRATHVRDWGEPGGRLGQGQNNGVAYYKFGILWDEEDQRLHQSYGHWYGTPQTQNPVVVAATLNGDGTTTLQGPWRGSSVIDWSAQWGNMMIVPEWARTTFGFPKVAVHAFRTVQFSFAGMMLYGYTPPDATSPRDTPSDWTTGDTSRNTATSFTWTPMIHHPGNAAGSPDGVAHPQAMPTWSGDRYACNGGCNYPVYEGTIDGPEPGTQSYWCSRTVAADTPLLLARNFNAVGTDVGTSGRNYNDILASANDGLWATGWIDTGNKHGLLSLGIIQTEGHLWYGNYNHHEELGAPPVGTCWHGLQIMWGGGTGNTGTQCLPYFQIIDPEELAPVVAGTRDPWNVPIAYSGNAKTGFGDDDRWTTALPTHFESGQLGTYGGITSMQFPDGNWYVFISQTGVDLDINGRWPVVKVFRVAA